MNVKIPSVVLKDFFCPLKCALKWAARGPLAHLTSQMEGQGNPLFHDAILPHELIYRLAYNYDNNIYTGYRLHDVPSFKNEIYYFQAIVI